MAIQWPLVLFSLMAGAAGAVLALSGLSSLIGGCATTRRRAVWTALVLLVAGGLCSVAHLASPLNAISAVTNLLSFSGISIELMLLAANFIVGVVYLILTRERVHGGVQVVAVLAIVFGIAIGFFCGHGYVIDAQPTWNSESLPFAYAGTSLALGGFIYALIASMAPKPSLSEGADQTETASKLPWAVLAASALGAIGIAAYLLFLGLDAASAQGTLFWGGAVACGIVGTLACAVINLTPLAARGAMPIAIAGIVCAAAGGIAVRMLMWTCASGYIDLFSLGIPSVIMNL